MVTPHEPAPGETATVRVTVQNNRSEQADGLRLSDKSVDGAEMRSASASQGSCSVTATQFTCELGSLEPGNTAEVTASLIVGTSQSGALLQRASLSGGGSPSVDVTLSNAITHVDQEHSGGVPRTVVTATSLGLLATTAGIYSGERTYRRRRSR